MFLVSITIIDNNPTEAMVTNVVGHVVGGDRTNSIEQALTNAVESLTNAVGYQEKMLNIALEQVKNQQESYCMQSLSDQSKSSHSHVLNVDGVDGNLQFPFILYEMLEYKYSKSISWAMDDESFYIDQKDKEYSLFVSSKSFPNTISFVLWDESVKLMYICSPSRFFFRLISSIIGTSVVWVYTMATHVGLTRTLSVVDPNYSTISKEFKMVLLYNTKINFFGYDGSFDMRGLTQYYCFSQEYHQRWYVHTRDDRLFIM